MKPVYSRELSRAVQALPQPNHEGQTHTVFIYRKNNAAFADANNAAPIAAIKVAIDPQR